MEFDTTKTAEEFLDFLATRYGSKFVASVFEKIDHYKRLGRQRLQQEGLLSHLTGTGGRRLLKLKFRSKPTVYLFGRFEGDVFMANHGVVKNYEGPVRRRDVELAITRSR